MKTAKDVKLARALLQTLEQAKEWRETFRKQRGPKHAEVLFQDISTTVMGYEDGRTLHGWDGEMAMPREIAIAAMIFIEADVKLRLRKLGVKI